MYLSFSIIIPVYNRPDELDELLTSITSQDFKYGFEVLVIEDGSKLTAKHIIQKFENKLDIRYLNKENSGPGLSRNFGMQNAKGSYYIILDSDCILPKSYLTTILETLSNNFTDAYGGADAAHDSFTNIQKAINYAMTSVLTTGGLRGNNNQKKFQPRSFNMGMSKEAFNGTGGFSAMRYGEDIDLTFRLWENGFETQFIKEAVVYHKRRATWKSFFNQTFNFGAARPILNKLYPNTAKITYWFPAVFVLGFVLSILGAFLGFFWLALLFILYFIFIFFDSTIKNKNAVVALLGIWATLVMFFGYGLGFLRSKLRLLLGKSPKEAFPEMFGQ